MQNSIEVLVKLFDRYKDIEAYQQTLDEQKKKLEAFRDARRYRFVPDLVGGTAQYEENLASIKNLEQRLETLIIEQSEAHTGEDIEKCQIKAQLINKLFPVTVKAFIIQMSVCINDSCTRHYFTLPSAPKKRFSGHTN